jgi:hypothetical protein
VDVDGGFKTDNQENSLKVGTNTSKSGLIQFELNYGTNDLLSLQNKQGILELMGGGGIRLTGSYIGHFFG